MGILKAIGVELKLIWKIFTDCLSAVITTEENLLWMDAVNLMKAEGIAIQNAQPGIDAKAFIALLVETATPLLVGDLAQLGVAAKTIIAATIAKDLAVPDAGGNAGNVTNDASGQGTTS